MTNPKHMLNMSPEERQRLKLDDLEPDLVAEAETYARFRWLQYQAYMRAGFSREQAFELLKHPRHMI